MEAEPQQLTNVAEVLSMTFTKFGIEPDSATESTLDIDEDELKSYVIGLYHGTHKIEITVAAQDVIYETNPSNSDYARAAAAIDGMFRGTMYLDLVSYGSEEQGGAQVTNIIYYTYYWDDIFTMSLCDHTPTVIYDLVNSSAASMGEVLTYQD